MKSIQYIIVALICAFFAQIDAYTWQFSNKTDEALLIKVKLVASSKEFFSVSIFIKFLNNVY